MKTIASVILLFLLNYSTLYAQKDPARVDSLFIALVEKHNGMKYQKFGYLQKAAENHAMYLRNLALANPHLKYREIHFRSPHRQFNIDGSKSETLHDVADRVTYFLDDTQITLAYATEIINFIGLPNGNFTDEKIAQLTLEGYLSSPPHKEGLEDRKHMAIASYTWFLKRPDGYIWVQNVTVFVARLTAVSY